MPTSNDTRVRVEGRSKIIASVLPSSGFLPLSCALSFAFMSALSGQHVAQLARRQFADVEEVTDGFAHHPAAFFN